MENIQLVQICKHSGNYSCKSFGLRKASEKADSMGNHVFSIAIGSEQNKLVEFWDLYASTSSSGNTLTICGVQESSQKSAARAASPDYEKIWVAIKLAGGTGSPGPISALQPLSNAQKIRKLHVVLSVSVARACQINMTAKPQVMHTCLSHCPAFEGVQEQSLRLLMSPGKTSAPNNWATI